MSQRNDPRRPRQERARLEEDEPGTDRGEFSDCRRRNVVDPIDVGNELIGNRHQRDVGDRELTPLDQAQQDVKRPLVPWEPQLVAIEWVEVCRPSAHVTLSLRDAGP